MTETTSIMSEINFRNAFWQPSLKNLSQVLLDKSFKANGQAVATSSMLQALMLIAANSASRESIESMKVMTDSSLHIFIPSKNEEPGLDIDLNNLAEQTYESLLETLTNMGYEPIDAKKTIKTLYVTLATKQIVKTDNFDKIGFEKLSDTEYRFDFGGGKLVKLNTRDQSIIYSFNNGTNWTTDKNLGEARYKKVEDTLNGFFGKYTDITPDMQKKIADKIKQFAHLTQLEKELSFVLKFDDDDEKKTKQKEYILLIKNIVEATYAAEEKNKILLSDYLIQNFAKSGTLQSTSTISEGLERSFNTGFFTGIFEDFDELQDFYFSKNEKGEIQEINYNNFVPQNIGMYFSVKQADGSTKNVNLYPAWPNFQSIHKEGLLQSLGEEKEINYKTLIKQILELQIAMTKAICPKDKQCAVFVNEPNAYFSGLSKDEQPIYAKWFEEAFKEITDEHKDITFIARETPALLDVLKQNKGEQIYSADDEDPKKRKTLFKKENIYVANGLDFNKIVLSDEFASCYIVNPDTIANPGNGFFCGGGFEAMEETGAKYLGLILADLKLQYSYEKIIEQNRVADSTEMTDTSVKAEDEKKFDTFTLGVPTAATSTDAAAAAVATSTDAASLLTSVLSKTALYSIKQPERCQSSAGYAVRS